QDDAVHRPYLLANCGSPPGFSLRIGTGTAGVRLCAVAMSARVAIPTNPGHTGKCRRQTLHLATIPRAGGPEQTRPAPGTGTAPAEDNAAAPAPRRRCAPNAHEISPPAPYNQQSSPGLSRPP